MIIGNLSAIGRSRRNPLGFYGFSLAIIYVCVLSVTLKTDRLFFYLLHPQAVAVAADDSAVEIF